MSLGTTEEDVVDNRVGLTPAVERTTTVGLGSYLAGVEHLGIQGLEDGIRCNGVEVGREECGHTHGNDLGKTLADQCQALALCHLADVVEVGVDVGELLARILHTQLSPGARALARSVPTHRGLLGGLREPEGAAIQKLNLILEVEDGHMLTRRYAILAAYADVAVLGQVLNQILHLLGLGLLQTEDGGLLLVDHSNGCVLAQVPLVLAVTLVVYAHVVRDDLDVVLLLGARAQRESCGSRQGK